MNRIVPPARRRRQTSQSATALCAILWPLPWGSLLPLPLPGWCGVVGLTSAMAIKKLVGGKGRSLLRAAQSQCCLEELRVTSREHLVSVARDGHLQKGPSESGVSCTFAAAHRTFRGPKEVAPGNSRSLATGPHAMRYFCLRHSPCVRTALRASRQG